MRFHLLFIFAFAILMLAVPARAYDPEFAKIVSYSKLMTLSPEMRTEYIRQVRLMVSEFEEMQKLNASDAKSVAEFKERSLFLNLMIEEAEAMGAGPGGAAYAAARARQQLPAPQSTSSGFTATPQSRALWSRAVADQYRCSSQVSRSAMVHSLHERGVQVRCLSSLYRGCERGFQQIGFVGGRYVCSKVPDKSRSVVTTQNRSPDRSRRTSPPAIARPIERDPATSARERTRNAAPARERDREQAREALNDTRRSLPSTGGSTQSNSVSAQTTGAIGDADAVQDAAIESTTATEDQHAVTALPIFQIHATSLFERVNPFDAVTETEQSCHDKISASVDETTCNDTTIATARRSYYRTSNPHCLFAGNLRHYAGNQKRPGNCQLPREFCISNVACRHADNSFVNRAEQPLVRCANPNHILCNPMLFNLDENSGPLCVAPTKDATLACNTRAETVEAHLRAQNKPYDPFIYRIKVAGTNAETERAAGLAGIQEAWDQFAKEMNSICNDVPSKDLYCRECQVMKKRAATLNLVVFNQSKPALNGNCYEFKRDLRGYDRNGDATTTGRALPPSNSSTNAESP